MTYRIERVAWYQPGIEHGNPVVNSRFRVNAPEAALNLEFAARDEVRGNGMMQIRIDDDLRRIDAAALQIVHWGGHPGTAAKRVTVNGRTTYPLPETGTAAGHCTHGSPVIHLAITDLVAGYNALQFACDQVTSFWGHFIVDDAALRLTLQPDHPDLVSAGLDRLTAAVEVVPADGERVRLQLITDDAAAIAAVTYIATYKGYDENGNGLAYDAHGFIKNREWLGTAGQATQPPFQAIWDRTMLPVCDDVTVQAIVTLHHHPDLALITDPVAAPPIAHQGVRVELVGASRLPHPFWSRDGEEKACTLSVPVAPERIDRAQLHMAIWDGGRGTVTDPITLNGHPVSIAGDGAHDVRYRVADVNPRILHQGENDLRVLSDTEHHGIEVLLPGPALALRYR